MSYNIPLPVNESRWQYQTASGGGLTVVMVAGSGGSIILRSPQGEDVSYRYGGVGVGGGFGARLPRFGKINIQIKGKGVSAAGAAEALPSTGKVFVSDALVNRDLTSDDITGPCMYTEVGGGPVVRWFGHGLVVRARSQVAGFVGGPELQSGNFAHRFGHGQPATGALGQGGGGHGGCERWFAGRWRCGDLHRLSVLTRCGGELAPTLIAPI